MAGGTTLADKDLIQTTSRIACQGILDELGDLARRAERAGASPQGERLAKAAKAIAKGNYEQAMRIRDEIKSDLDIQQADKSFNSTLLLLFVGVPLVSVLLALLR